MRITRYPSYGAQLCGCPCPSCVNAKGGGGKGGGSYEAPPPAPVPKAEVAKPVSEAATAARTAQKEKAQRSAGIQGSILSSPVGSGSAGPQVKTLLGQ